MQAKHDLTVQFKPICSFLQCTLHRTTFYITYRLPEIACILCAVYFCCAHYITGQLCVLIEKLCRQ
jgi:hypothetical protein